MSIATDLDAAAGIFDPTTDPVIFQADKHPVDYYLAVGRSFRGDLLLNNHEVGGVLSILEENLTKHFLPKRITDFGTNIRTIVSVSGTCLRNTSTKAPEKQLLGDCLHFVVGNYHFLFPDVKVNAFLVDPANIQSTLPPSLPGDLEKNRAKCFMASISCILLLVKRAAIVEVPINSDKVIESLESCHPAAGNWALLMEMGNVVGMCTSTRGRLSQDQRQTTILTRTSSKCGVYRDQVVHKVRSDGERKGVYFSKPYRRQHTQQFIVTKAASVASSVVAQVSERMNLFQSLFFAFPAVDASGKSTHLTLGSIIDEMKELFAS